MKPSGRGDQTDNAQATKPQPVSPSDREEERSVFVKLKESVKIKLDQIAESYTAKQTLADAISQLVVGFSDLSETEKQNFIVSVGKAAPLAHLEHRVGDLQAADHSFALKRWIRAIEDHERLLDPLTTIKQAEQRFESWAYYRLSYIWIDIAYERRAAGINNHPESLASGEAEDGWELQYDLAIAALEQSIEYGDQVGQPMQNIAIFNRACARSLLGQYLVERALLAGEVNVHSKRKDEEVAAGEYLEGLKKRLFKEIATPHAAEVAGRRAKARPKLVATEAFDWLTQYRPSSELSRTVQKHADKALRELDEVYRHRSHSGEEATLSWLLVSMSKDNDLTFLSTAELYKGRFDNFLSTLRDHGDTVTEWCRKKLDRFLPKRSSDGSSAKG